MYLPKQAEPIHRSVDIAENPGVNGVEPRMDCYCINGTWHCDIGKDLWDTGIECNGKDTAKQSA